MQLHLFTFGLVSYTNPEIFVRSFNLKVRFNPFVMSRTGVAKFFIPLEN